VDFVHLCCCVWFPVALTDGGVLIYFLNFTVVASKVDGVWQKMTFKEYYNNVIAAAKSLIKVCYEVKYNVVMMI